MTVINPEIQARINQFLNVFEPHSREARISHVRDDDEKVYSGQLCLSANDILCVIDFLRPDLASLSTSAKAGETPSTASSVAGSSTLTSGSVGVDSAIASSIAPSTSGTSMTSSTFIGEGSFNDAQIKADESPTSPLETFDSKSSTTGFKEGSEIHLEEIYHGVKDLIAVGKDYGSNQSVNDWAFIYIFNDDKKVSLSRANMIELSSSKVTCSTDELSIPSKNDKSGSDALKEAVLRIMADYDTFYSLNLEIEACSDNASTLKRLFEIALSHCQANLDFENSLFWWKNIQLLHRISCTLRADEFDIFLREIERDLQIKLKTQSKAIEQNIEWHHSLNTIQRRQIRSLQVLGNQQRALRVKMWYVSDVCNSATYEGASYVTRALRAMANSSHTKKPGALSNWGRHRFRNSFGQDKSESQTLEAMTAHRDHGGLSKLADEQVEMTTRWLTKNSVENFCKGEERIHRFCFEVQKCVNKLAGLTLLDSPVLWASRLFEREKLLFDTRASRSTSYDLHYKSSSTTPEPWSSSKSAPSQPPMSINGVSSDLFVFKPGYLSNHLSGNWNLPKGLDISNSIGSNAQSRLDFSSSVTLPLYPQPSLQSFTTFGYSKPNSIISEEMNTAKRRFSQEVKKTLCSLLISDLGYLMWAQGSETDGWINLEPVDWEIQASGSRAAPQSNVERSNTTEAFVVSKKELDAKQGLEGPRSAPPDYLVSSTIQGLQSSEILSHDSHSPFPYKEAYKILLDRLSYSSDPFTKLQSLAELENLISDSMLDDVSKQHKLLAAHDRTNFPYSGASSAGNHLINIPRTKATSLEEVIANCTERRAGTMKLQVPMNNSSVTSRLDVPDLSLPSSDSTVSTLLAILRDPFLRPPTLFRDLQFIAAFIPPDILDQTSQGKAFWDAGLAALALKEDLSSSMIKRATQIAAYHISPSTCNSEPSLAHTTLRDAARLWLTIAKEGSPIAARELGLFYLTDPKILPRVTLPLSKAKDVFRATMGGDQGNGSGGARGGDLGQTGRLDPLTFAVVFHWMEGAANGGDRDARDFLRGTGELSGGR